MPTDSLRTASVAAAVLLACPMAGASAVGDEPIGLKVHQAVATRGAGVELLARPLCGIAGPDADSRARAVGFMARFVLAIANSLAKTEVSPDLGTWRAELRIVDHPAPGSDEGGGVRITKSSPGLDLILMRALLSANVPALPNFRARCTFEITVQKAGGSSGGAVEQGDEADER